VKKFQFGLEGVARVRKHELKTRQTALADASRELQAAEETRTRLVAVLKETLEQSPRGSVVDIRALLTLERERESLRRQLLRENLRVEQSLDRVERERRDLLESKRRSEAVEQLRQTRYAEFVRAVLRDEQKVTDEVAGKSRLPGAALVREAA